MLLSLSCGGIIFNYPLASGGQALPFVLLKNVKCSLSHLHFTTRKRTRPAERTLTVSEQLSVRKCCCASSWVMKTESSGSWGLFTGVDSCTESSRWCKRTCTTGIKPQDVAVKLSLLRRPKMVQCSRLIFRIICYFPCDRFRLQGSSQAAFMNSRLLLGAWSLMSWKYEGH